MQRLRRIFLARAAVTLLLAVLTTVTVWAHSTITKDGKNYTLFQGSTFYTVDGNDLTGNTNNNSNEVPAKLFDNDTNTKWCYVSNSEEYKTPTWKNLNIYFHTSESIILKGYQMARGADYATYPRRDPKSWKIYGSNSAGANATWTKIDERTNVTLGTPWKDFLMTSNTTAYQYYRLEVTSVDNYEVEDYGYRRWKCQLSELQFFGITLEEYSHDLSTATVTGLPETYTYTGNSISVSGYTVKSLVNKTVNSSSYQATISPSPVKDPGTYTLTITGKNGYSGTTSVTFRVVKPLTGNGTSESPYLINNMIEWLAFADYISGDNAHYGDKKYKLCTNLSSVTTMVGTSANPFKGEFNGDGHTLNLNLSADAQYCAPFRYVDGATIKNVHTTGTVTAGSATENNQNKYRAGLIGNAKSGTKIYNCWSSVTINSSLTGDGTHGGFIGIVDGSVEFHDCLFDGTISGSTTTNCGGFVGWNSRSFLSLYNCLMAGTLNINVDNNCATFSRNNGFWSFENNYYKTAYGAEQGTAVGTMSNAELRAALGKQWEILNNKVVPIIDTKNITLGSLTCGANFKRTGSTIVLAPTVKDMLGNVLTKGTDYTISYNPSSVVNDGDYVMTVTGKGSYRGQLTHNFRVSSLPDPMYTDADFTQNQLGYYAVNIPQDGTATLDLSDFNFTSSFKIYDNGGKAGNAQPGTSYLKIIAPAGYLIRISGQSSPDNYYSCMSIYDGGSVDASRSIGKQYKHKGEDIGTLTTTGQEMFIYFSTSNSNGSKTNPGVDLTVSLVKASTKNNITVKSATGGSISVSPTSAAANSNVTMAVSPNSGYKLCNLKATDAFGNPVDLSHLLWYNTTPGTFKMPSSALTITPTFTNNWSAEGGLYINMPKHNTADAPLSVNIPSNVKTLKIYDDGGKDSICGYGCDGYLLLTAPSGYRLSLSGTASLSWAGDGLEIYDGNTKDSKKRLAQYKDENNTVIPVESSGTQLLLHLATSTGEYDGLDLTLRVFQTGTQNNITVKSVTGGQVTASVSKATLGDQVTLTISRNTGYVLQSLEVKDADGNNISTGDWNWGNVGTSVSFTMPVSAVTITPVFTSEPTINLKKSSSSLSNAEVLNIPSDIKKFWVYDDGGKDGNSSSNSSYMILIAPQGYRLVARGRVNIYDYYKSYLKIYDGNSTSSQLGSFNGNKDIDRLVSTGNQMLLEFSPNSSNYEGFELSVSSFNPETSHTISVKSVTGGTVTASPNSAKYDGEVTLTVKPNKNYALQSIDVKDADGYTVKNTDFSWYNGGSTPTFHMVESNVTVTPTFVKQPSVNIPKSSTASAPLTVTIPNDIASIKVYDDGGKDANYSSRCDEYLLINAPAGKRLKLTGTMDINHAWLEVFDGNTNASEKRIGNVGTNNTDHNLVVSPLLSTGTQLLLRFSCSGYTPEAGLDLNVTVVEPTTQNSITVVNPEEGGTVEASATSAKLDDVVTLTVKPAKGYVLESLLVKDADNLVINVNDGVWYSGTNPTFAMSSAAVTVTPTFSRQAFVNMPTTSTVEQPLSVNIPASMLSFKIYDNGGKDGNYSNNYDGYLQLKAPAECHIRLTGSVKSEGGWDYLKVYDGNTIDSRLGNEKYGNGNSNGEDIGTLVSTDNQMLLYFHSDGGTNYSGLDLTAEIVNPVSDFNVVVSNPEAGGTVTALPTSAKWSEEVTLTVEPADGYLLKEFIVKDAADNDVSVTGGMWYDVTPTATFNMPSSDVTVTPVFTNGKTLDAGLYVNMPATSTVEAPMTVNIPAGLQAFKVYDDGGKDGNNSAKCNGYLLLTAPEGCVLRLTGTVNTYSSSVGDCCLKVYNGATTSSRLGNEYYSGSNASIGLLQSSGNQMLLNFKSVRDTYSGLDLTVSVLSSDVAHTVTVNESEGGIVTANPAEATANTAVTLAVAPTDATWMLNDLVVKDVDNQPVEVSDALWYTDNTTATFTMPYVGVSVTPTFVNNWTAEGGLSVNMPSVANTASTPKTVTIPAGVTSFKVYDNGGKDGKTNGKGSNYMLLIAPDGYLLQLTGKVKTSTSNPLKVYDGEEGNSLKIIGNSQYGHDNGDGEDVGTLFSTGNKMLLYYHNGYTYQGLDLTVTLVNASIEHTVAVNDALTGGGSVIASVTKATHGTQVALTVAPDNGYILSDCIVKDAFNNTVSVTGGTWYDNAETTFFNMPASGVTVTPVFANNLTAEGEDALSVNMPSFSAGSGYPKQVHVPAGVSSFKVYDNGGKDGNYSDNCSGYLLLTAPEGKLIRLTGSVETHNSSDYLKVYNNNTTNSSALQGTFSGSRDIDKLTSDDNQMLLYFCSNGSNNAAGLDLTATIVSADIEYDVTISATEGGVVEASKTKAAYKDQVTLTVKPAQGYILTSLTAKDSDDKTLASMDWSSGTSSTFTMPANAVTVTATFSQNLTGLYVNMKQTGTTASDAMKVDVPVGVQSFNVYDNGGKDGNYSDNFDGYLLITAPAQCLIQLTGTITTESTYYDYLKVYDGNTTANRLGNEVYGGTGGDNVGTLLSTDNQMLLYFRSDGSNVYSGLNLQVTLLPSVVLADAATDNSTTIAGNVGEEKRVILKDRMLYKDGEWNTICLPFDVDLTDVNNPLYGAEAKTLTGASVNDTHVSLTFGNPDSATEPVTTLKAGTPYIIRWNADLVIKTMADWDAFAEAVAGGNTFAGKLVKLANDIEVSTMVGTRNAKFKGTFDGNGHTLTLNNLSATTEFCAPFRYVNGATIVNLHTTGTVIAGENTTNDKFRTGLIGHSENSTTISNCWSSVTITSSLDGDGTHGGFIGVSDGTATITDCLFDGTFNGSKTKSWGGFVGWSNNTTTIKNSVFAPEGISIKCSASDDDNATFCRNKVSTSNCYYSQALTNNGSAARNGASIIGSRTGEQLATALGNGWQVKDNKVVPNANYVKTITEPTFKDVTVKSSTSDSRTIVKADGKVKFIGYYDAFDVTPQDDDIYYMTPGNMLKHTALTRTLKACRAYFQFSDNGMKAREFILNFGDEETTAIDEMRNENVEMRNDAWYTVDGVKLSGKPTRKGIYIFNGKKTVIR